MAQETLGRVILTVLHSLAGMISLLPSRAVYWMGAALGRFLFAVGFRRKVVERNLLLAFPGDSQEVASLRSRLLAEAFRHLGQVFLEIFLLFGFFDRYVRRNIRVRGIENWAKAKESGKGVIFLASHVGNWELMAAGFADAGDPVMLVTKHLKPEWFHRAIERARGRAGVLATYEPRTLKDVFRHLAKNGTVGMVLDQYTGPPVGVRVPFFGIPVGTNLGLATVARRTGAPVVPIMNHRLADGSFEVEIFPALQWIPDEHPDVELARNTAAYSAILEGQVRLYPGQWLWSHQRFKGDLSPLREGEWEEGRARRARL